MLESDKIGAIDGPNAFVPSSFVDDAMAGKPAATSLLRHMEDVECTVKCLLPGDTEAATAAYWHDAQKIRGWDDGWSIVQENTLTKPEIMDRYPGLWERTVDQHSGNNGANTWVPEQFAGTRTGAMIGGHHVHALADNPGLNAVRIGDAISAQTRPYAGVKSWGEAWDSVVTNNWRSGYFQNKLSWPMLRDPLLRGLR